MPFPQHTYTQSTGRVYDPSGGTTHTKLFVVSESDKSVISQVLKREYTYNRTVSVKNTDGSETHKTMKLRTPHDETHCM